MALEVDITKKLDGFFYAYAVPGGAGEFLRFSARRAVEKA